MARAWPSTVCCSAARVTTAASGNHPPCDPRVGGITTPERQPWRRRGTPELRATRRVTNACRGGSLFVLLANDPGAAHGRGGRTGMHALPDLAIQEHFVRPVGDREIAGRNRR